MKKNLSELVFILDMSGSMHGLVQDTIGGYNSLIDQQKAEEGDAFVTTVLFDDQYELLHDHVNIKDISPITEKEYHPRGMTALLDAVGRTINNIGERLANTPEEERPEKVMIVITTDGMENASREFKRDQIKAMIEHQQEKYSWVFMFLGANMDAVAEASTLGIGSHYSKSYSNTGRGVETVYTSVSNSMAALRSSSAACYASEEARAKVVADALDDVE